MSESFMRRSVVNVVFELRCVDKKKLVSCVICLLKFQNYF